MSRFQTTIRTAKDSTAVSEAITKYLKAQGFKLQSGDENIWKKGGSFSNPLFVRTRPAAGAIELEAWIRFVILPGVYVGEFDLEGMFLMVQKRQLKAHVEAITKLAG
jgi:hypothetical protein